jgi:hypothetical protein
VKRISFNYPLVTPVLRVFLVFVFAIFSGGLIYILLRPAEPVFFEWFTSVGLEDFLFNIRQYSLSFNRHVPEWFIYSLPNGLWAFAYSLFTTVVWRKSKSPMKYFWMGTIPLLIYGFEGLQYFQVIPGTFCTHDLLMGTFGLMTGIYTGIKSF